MAKSKPGTPTPEERIRDTIAYADRHAGSDDRQFLRALKATIRETKEGGSTRSAARTAAVDLREAESRIANDPRYLQNARELAKRSLGGSRILGGKPVREGEFLDCVAIGNDAMWGCTGTLIAPDVVLTAGHCVQCATRIYIGTDVTKEGKTIAVKARHQHPDYHTSKQNDLMVLVLAEKVRGVDPRKLAAKKLIDKATDGRAVGFGNTDPRGLFGYGKKRYVDVPIASNACRGKFNQSPDRAVYGCDPGYELVAGKPLLEADSCTGDSGGPFYILNDGKWELAGATSRATISAMHACGDGGIYVRVDAYRAWIEKLPGVTLPK